MRAMLKGADLSIEFWDEAVEADAYLRNRSAVGPLAESKPILPEGIWTGKEQSVDYIKTWGCKCYSYVNPKSLPAEARHKLVDRARVAVFVGYELNTTKQFRIYASDLGYVTKSV